MPRKLFLLFSLFVIPVIVVMTPLPARSDAADPEEVAHMKAGHQKVEGIVTELKSGLIIIKSSNGATLTLTESGGLSSRQTRPKNRR